MGATNFVTVAEGKTVDDAFNTAVREAQYESGHGGYTGTIAEKHGFVVFDRAKETRDLVDRLKRQKSELTVAGLTKMKKRLDELTSKLSDPTFTKGRLSQFGFGSHDYRHVDAAEAEVEQIQRVLGQIARYERGDYYPSGSFDRGAPMTTAQAAAAVRGDVQKSIQEVKADPIALARYLTSDPRVQDKHGPAGAVQDTRRGAKHRWVFFGYASS